MKFTKLLDLMDMLLGENGCPWDREQTHESLQKYLLEECHELIDAINERDTEHIIEELGDVLLQVVFHAKIAEKAGKFTIDDVVTCITQKLIRRHSHIFGEDTANNAEEVAALWAKNKAKEVE